MRRQLSSLVRPGFAGDAGAAPLAHLGRYVAAVEARLTKLPERPTRDRELMATVQRLEDEHRALAERTRRTESSDEQRAAVTAIGWMLQELRVSLFAQMLGTAHAVSTTRVRSELTRWS